MLAGQRQREDVPIHARTAAEKTVRGSLMNRPSCLPHPHPHPPNDQIGQGTELNNGSHYYLSYVVMHNHSGSDSVSLSISSVSPRWNLGLSTFFGNNWAINEPNEPDCLMTATVFPLNALVASVARVLNFRKICHA